ncbi:unnamed protein product [Cuscuta campestris]|uniref:Flowering time control protein FCA n=1 Tax=Cuscuta campestris TaxID=132261 RepID=A0A484K5R0_9ASTE|nr:unnamed protein product [Cuscuta campestris]
MTVVSSLLLSYYFFCTLDLAFCFYAYGCCFIKYATSEDADRAIRALHNNYTLPGGIAPIQVRYADGERERLGTVEYKLFVGSLSKQASVKDVEEIFSPYGRVEDVYLMRDEMKQSRGCGFVKYSNREVALAAIDGLNGKFTMRGCDQPLIVRFADPKKPRFGESRDPSFVGPGYGPRFQAPGIRPPHPNLTEPAYGQNAPNSWRPMPAFNPSQVSNAINTHGFGNQVSPRSNDMQAPSSLGGRGASGDNSFPMRPVPSPSMAQQGGHSSSGDSSYPGFPVSSSSSSSMSQKGSNQPLVQSLSIGQQNSPSQKPLPSPQHFPSSLQQQKSPMLHGYGHPDTRIHGYGQPQVPIIPPSAGQTPVGKAMTPQQNVPSGSSNQQHQAQQTLQHQPPSQLAQMMSQQTQTLQASFQSSQQAFSQLQHQQRQMMQPPSNQNATTTQLQQHSSWPGHAQQQPPPVTSFQSPLVATSQPVAAFKCDWTEHTAPDGYKYYHNSVTGESKWEKPEELTLFEQQQQKQQEQTKPSSTTQQPQMQSYPQQGISQHQAFHMQGQYQSPLQIQLRAPQQLQQQTSQAPSYHQDPGRIVQRSNQEHSYAHLPHAAGSANDTLHIQQGLHAGQEWMSKRP